MKTFLITFQGDVRKRVLCPTDADLKAFLDKFEVATEVVEVSTLEDYSGDLDVILNESGDIELGQKTPEWWKREIECVKRPPMNRYEARRSEKKGAQVWLNDKPFSHRPSLEIYNHSPDGFEWGYHGSGPAQLALAILLEETGNPQFALEHYQDFKRDVIATATQPGWGFGSPFVRKWIREKTCDN